MAAYLSTAAFNPLPAGSLETYIQTVNQVPMLTLEEEQALARRLQTENDLDAARCLIMSHLRFVVRVARSYMGYGLPLADLIQEGTIGLMKAVRRFDPDVGVRLVSFAVHWVKAEIHEYILRNWRIVKVATTKAQRKMFFNLRKMKKRLGWFTAEEVNAVAEDLGVTPEVVQQMEARLNAQDASFDGPMLDGDNATGFAPADYLKSNALDPAQLIEAADTVQQGSDDLQQALLELDGRSRDILAQRWLVDEDKKKVTLHDLAAKYRVSAERIRQLEKNAMLQLKKHLSAADHAG